MIRLTAFLIVMSLGAPSMASVVCAWTCASEHVPVSTPARGGCHEHEAPADVPSVSGGHACHDLVELPDTVMTVSRQIEHPDAVLVAAGSAPVATATVRASVDSTAFSRPPGPAFLVLPLRL